MTTVSRVLNDKGYISDQTRQAVFKAMEVLDYQPNEVARSLFRQESKMIGLILPTVSHPFFAQFTQHVEFYAHFHGYKVMLC
ncbi:MAG: LacI family DNA-binding transcriptional regulator, partial [Turicibacter sp.]